MTHTPPQAHPNEHPEQHEHSDIHIRPLIIFAIVALVFAAVSHVALYYLYGLYSALPAEQRKQMPRSAVTSQLPVPQPRIQGIPGFHPDTPRADMEQLQQRYIMALNSYGPADSPGFMRIPIDRAMQLLLQTGLPATQPTTQPTANPR